MVAFPKKPVNGQSFTDPDTEVTFVYLTQRKKWFTIGDVDSVIPYGLIYTGTLPPAPSLTARGFLWYDPSNGSLYVRSSEETHDKDWWLPVVGTYNSLKDLSDRDLFFPPNIKDGDLVYMQNGKIYKYNEKKRRWELVSLEELCMEEGTFEPSTSLGSGATTFLELGDTPNTTYTGQAEKVATVDPTEQGIVFTDTVKSFLDLEDTPSTYIGHGQKFLVVKNTEDGISFATIPNGNTAVDFLALTNTPSSFAGEAGKALTINNSEDGLTCDTLVTTFTELTDTPSSFSKTAGFVPIVNGTEDALILKAFSFKNLIDTPTSLGLNAGDTLIVNETGDALEFYQRGMTWKGEWKNGVTYNLHDVARDGLWTMVAMRQTIERPAPSFGSPSTWVAYPTATPTWTLGLSTNQAATWGIKYFPPNPVEAITKFRIWVESTLPVYSIVVRRIVGGEIVDSRIVSYRLSFLSTGWTVLPVEGGPIFLQDSAEYDIFTIAEWVDQTPEGFSGTWDVRRNNNGIPSASDGRAIWSNTGRVRFSRVDKNSTDFSTEFLSLPVGAELTVSGTRFIVTSKTITSYGVEITVDNNSRPTSGDKVHDFSWFAPVPVDYVIGPNALVGNPYAEGIFEDDSGSLSPDNGYGLDIETARVDAPEDWDLLAYSDVSSFYSGSLTTSQGAGVGTFSDPGIVRAITSQDGLNIADTTTDLVWQAPVSISTIEISSSGAEFTANSTGYYKFYVSLVVRCSTDSEIKLRALKDTGGGFAPIPDSSISAYITDEVASQETGGLNFSDICLLEEGDKLKFQSITDVKDSSPLTIEQDGTYVILEKK